MQIKPLYCNITQKKGFSFVYRVDNGYVTKNTDELFHFFVPSPVNLK